MILEPETVVPTALEGLVAAYPHLTLLDGLPDVKVVVNRDADKRNVALISGGGSGHEPAHAGFVGAGMLTAAVAGDVFASPSAQAVLAAIRAVTGPSGCLLIVKNYTGDRLNFGMAAEQAKAEGFKVEMVVVADDCALPEKGIAGRRGIAGTVFVHKVAGAAAAAGLPLDSVKREAEAAARAVGSMGVASRVCTLPGGQPSTRLKPGEMELGLGIHGEPGAEKLAVQPVDKVVVRVLDTIATSGYLTLRAGAPVALLVNTLGATSTLELYVVLQAALQYLRDHLQVTVERIYCGSFMTSLDMEGWSLSLLLLGGQRAEWLDAATQAPAWPAGPAVAEPGKARTPLPAPPASAQAALRRPGHVSAQGALLERVITAAARAILAQAEQLDEWDKQVGDGDCGSTLRRGAEAILRDLPDLYPVNDAPATARALADTVARAMGGSSGALYSIFFTTAANSLKGARTAEEALPPDAWAAALAAGTAAMQRYGGAAPGSRTMLDALAPAAEALQEAINSGESAAAAGAAAAHAASEGAVATAAMEAALAGRASYVPAAALAGVPDPGAAAVATWLQAVADALAA